MAKVRWNGSGRRLALGYEWPRPRAIVEVDDPEAVATLLAQPGEQFSVIEAEPKPGEAQVPRKIKKSGLKKAQEE